MWYITVAFFLTIFSIFEFAKRKVGQNYLFNIAWLVLTFMLVFRYGQGTDYYGYYQTYQNMDDTGEFFVNALTHGEIGWYMLNLAANKLGLSFFVFLGIVSLFEMLLIRRFIMRFSPYKTFSLLLFYPSFYLTACYSAIRQGVVLCVFLGLCVELLINRHYLKYSIIVFCMAFIHTSAVVLLVIPFAINFRFNRIFIVDALFLGAFILYVANKFAVVEEYSGYIVDDTRIGGVLVRLIMFLIIWRLHILYRKIGNVSEVEPVLFKVYLFGFIMSLLLFQSSTLAQRLTMPFKALEVVLIPILTFGNKNMLFYLKNRVKDSVVPFSFYLVIMIMNVEFVKNIYSYLDQGNYHSWVTPLDYPYSSVFDQKEIRKYISNFDEEND